MPSEEFDVSELAEMDKFWREHAPLPEVMHMGLDAFVQLAPDFQITEEMRRAGAVTVTKDGIFPCILPEYFIGEVA